MQDVFGLFLSSEGVAVQQLVDWSLSSDFLAFLRNARVECVFYIQLLDVLGNVLLVFKSVQALMNWGDVFAAVPRIDLRAESLELFFVLNCHFKVALFGLDFLDVFVLVF